MVKFEAIALPDVRKSWGWIRNGLMAVIERCPSTWIPEDVWTEVMARRAFVYALQHDGDEVGFAVLQPRSDGDGTVLFVWALWVEPGALHAQARRDEVHGELLRLAREIGVRRGRMEWNRGGGEGVAFWTPVMTIYEHEVT